MNAFDRLFDFHTPVSDRLEAAESLGTGIDQTRFYPLTGLMGRSEPELTSVLRRVLVEAGASRFFASQLASPDSEERRRAAEAMALVGDSESVPILIDALDDPDASVRAEVATTLMVFRDPQMESKITDRLISDPDPDVRAACAQALATLPGSLPQSILQAAYEAEEDEFARVLIDVSLQRQSALTEAERFEALRTRL